MKTSNFTLYALTFASGLAAITAFPGPARASYLAEVTYQESLRAYEEGDYKKAMLGFMDVVLEEPTNDLATEYLQRAGRRVLETEERNVQLQRKELLRSAEKIKIRLDGLAKAKALKLREWDESFFSVQRLAGSADTLQEAVLAYEEFVRKTPIYAEVQDEFAGREENVRRVFYETIKAGYPEMVRGTRRLDDATLAGVFLSREVLKGVSSKYINGGQTEGMLAKSSEIRQLRTDVAVLLNDEAFALDMYSAGKFEQAGALFSKILKACGVNEEAAFYSELVAERTAVVLPAPAPTAEPPCSGSLCAKASLAALKATPLTDAPPRKVNELPSVHAAMAAAEAARPAQASVVKQAAAEPAPVPVPVPVAEPAAAPQPSEAAQAAANTEADTIYELGVREFSIGNYAAAAKYWDECLRLNPEHSKAKRGIRRLKAMSDGK